MVYSKNVGPVTLGWEMTKGIKESKRGPFGGALKKKLEGYLDAADEYIFTKIEKKSRAKSAEVKSGVCFWIFGN